MTVPKPVLVIIAIVIMVVVGFAAVIFRMTPTNTQGKPEASANQLVSVQSVREFQQAHPDAFVMEVFGDGNFAPVIDQADNDVRIWCLDSRGETTMTVAEFAARSCQPAAVMGVYGGGFAGVNFGTKRGPGKLHAIIHQWGTNKFQSLAGMFMAFYSVKLPDLDSRQSGQRKTAESMTPPVMSAVPDLSETTTMANVFNSVVEIYGDISGWDVRRIQNFAHAFESSGFQGDLSTWQPVSATDMSNMFTNATRFDSDLSTWDVRNVTNMRGMFHLSGLSPANMSTILAGWSQQELSHDVKLGADDIYRCEDPAGDAGLQVLTETYGWSVTHAGVSSDCTPPGVTVVNRSDFLQPGARVKVAILEFDRDLKYWDSKCTAAPLAKSGEIRRLQCQLDIENGNVWLDMWAKDHHNNTVVKQEILAQR